MSEKKPFARKGQGTSISTKSYPEISSGLRLQEARLAEMVAPGYSRASTGHILDAILAWLLTQDVERQAAVLAEGARILEVLDKGPGGPLMPRDDDLRDTSGQRKPIKGGVDSDAGWKSVRPLSVPFGPDWPPQSQDDATRPPQVQGTPKRRR